MSQLVKLPVIHCCLLLFGCVLATGRLSAEPPTPLGAEPPTPPSTPAKDTNSRTLPKAKDLPAGPDEFTSALNRKKEEEKAKNVGVVLLAGVAILGVFLMAMVLVWGNRVRRMTRRPLPTQCRGDELWYLRPKKQLPNREVEPATDLPPATDEDTA